MNQSNRPDIQEVPRELRRWATGDCFFFAQALAEAAFEINGVDLEFGCHRSETGLVEHVFVFDKDNNRAYDVFGEHPLPYELDNWKDCYQTAASDLLVQFGDDPELVAEAEVDAFELWQSWN